ncbi:MAG: class I SAM-dependent rRNA methyltransferase [Bacteroidales bacterium]|nr:class I SAM-dependent rRNA methyltransferase [Bacteroidales bacterium]
MRRHPWIFSGAVRKIAGNPQEGDLVDVVAADGRWLAVGHYQSDSIICKVLSFDTQQVDEQFFRKRLQSAIAYRERLGLFGIENEELRIENYPSAAANSQFSNLNSQITNVFRLVHAEGDFMPGLVCDWYNGVLVMQAHSVGMHRLFPMLTELFVDLLGKHGIKSVFDKSSATVPGGCEDGYIWGDEPEEWEICEHGNRMLINFYEGQKIGFFVDQRENRNLVASLAEGQRVLNCFGYTGGFSLAALRGGASYVETVDISKKAIELCNRNVTLNFGNEAPHKGVVADVLNYLEEVDNQFNLIILDPPAFAKNHRSLQQGLKGYRNINQRAMEKIRPGGLLLTFSCSQAVSNDDFKTVCFTAAANAHKQVRIVRQLPHAIDHPVSIYHPEGEYLKGLLLEIE